jgi:hypothetical protein
VPRKLPVLNLGRANVDAEHPSSPEFDS